MLNRMSLLLKKPFQAREKHVLTGKCQSCEGGQWGEGWWWWWWIIIFPRLSKKWGFLSDRKAGREEVTISDSLHRWWPPSVNILVKMAVYLFSPSVYTERNKKGKGEKKRSVEKCLRRQNLWVHEGRRRGRKNVIWFSPLFQTSLSSLSGYIQLSSLSHPECSAAETPQLLRHNSHSTTED